MLTECTDSIFSPAVTLTAPEVQAGQTLSGSSSGYSVLEFIGEGCYGKVAKCRNLTTKVSVAVKILKQDDEFIQDTEKEVDFWTSSHDIQYCLVTLCLLYQSTRNLFVPQVFMLEVISVLNPDLL